MQLTSMRLSIHDLERHRINSRDCFHLEASFRTSVVIGFADRRTHRTTAVTEYVSIDLRQSSAQNADQHVYGFAGPVDGRQKKKPSRITEDRSIDRSLGFVRFYVAPTFPRVFDSTLLCILPYPAAAIERIAINARYRFIEPRRPDFRFTRYRPAIPDLIIRGRLAGRRKREYTRIILLDGRWQRALRFPPLYKFPARFSDHVAYGRYRGRSIAAFATSTRGVHEGLKIRGSRGGPRNGAACRPEFRETCLCVPSARRFGIRKTAGCGGRLKVFGMNEYASLRRHLRPAPRQTRSRQRMLDLDLYRGVSRTEELALEPVRNSANIIHSSTLDRANARNTLPRAR